jgi:hypothetical protein
MFFGKFLPTDGNFFELLNQHGSKIIEGSRAFMLMVQNYPDLALREKYASEVDAAERQADRITAEVNRLLHRTFITPIGREQILGLINGMDDILDLFQDVAETLSLYDVREVTEEVLHLAELASRCCERVQYAVTLLHKLNQTDVMESALKTCEEIDRLESDADRVMRAALSKLFREQVDVRELIKLKTTYEQLEAITDRCEDVANLIEGIVLENS